MDPSKSLLSSSGQNMAGEQRAISSLDSAVSRNWPTPWNLVQFWASSADTDPWVPRHTIPDEGLQFRARSNGYNFPARSVVPGPYVASRGNGPCDYMTLPSDSGYESRTKKSAEDSSVIEGMDRSHETRSVTGRLADFQPFGAPGPEQYGHHSGPQGDYFHALWSQQTAPAETRPGIAPPGLHCLICDKPVKNKSELKKHDQRHKKPHKCDVEGCTRREGFSTTNDLDRHKKSVHSTEGVKYRCRVGPCSNKEKTWPRADNFRSHLKRVHDRIVEADGDLSEFVIMPPAAGAPEGRASLEGVGSLMDYPYAGFPAVTSQEVWYDHRRPHVLPQADLDPSEASPISLHVPYSGQHVLEQLGGTDQCSTQARDCTTLSTDGADRPNLMHSISPDNVGSDAIAFENMFPGRPRPESFGNMVTAESIAAPEDDLTTEELQITECRVKTPDGASIGPETADNEGCKADKGITSTESTSITCDENDDQATEGDDCDSVVSSHKEEEGAGDPLVDIELEGRDEAYLLHMLEKIPREVMDKFLRDRKTQPSKKAKPPASNYAETQTLVCADPLCYKEFSRPCELKKHMKRHDKPYGCTFTDCTMRFGSKNDWKRHENSQHMQLETWKCHEPSCIGSDTICGKVFSRREQFKNHLTALHNITESEKLNKELQDRRIGRNGDSSFWCGFCAEIVFLPKDVNPAKSWTERFNHIDDHICGKNGLPAQNISEWQHLDASENGDASSGSSGSSSEDSLAKTEAADRDEQAVLEPVRAPMHKKKRAAEDTPLPGAKRLRV